MDAILLAAGYGTRLRPLTDRIPKALVPVGGVPMLERVARRLFDAGADRIVVTASHLADQVERYVAEATWADRAVVSVEPGAPLETGGGIRQAAALLPSGAPFVVHNADLLTTVDIADLMTRQSTSGALATLAVAPATTDRTLLVDADGLVGFVARGERRTVRATRGEVREVDFCGVHACSPSLVPALAAEPSAVFSVMDVYLREAARGARVDVFDGGATPHRFLDVGTPERLAEADVAVAAGRFA
ncbi:MAG TPA: sugar phosphate nucleotidyltransferase [Rubricoccaceae bacterium]|jgi:NDP-sugar pyrophosphorylase family protein